MYIFKDANDSGRLAEDPTFRCWPSRERTETSVTRSARVESETHIFDLNADNHVFMDERGSKSPGPCRSGR
jgi:hypothetical protein